ncbi:MAG: PAS domain-containing protein [Chloroflexi bacterium]|nr:PAS domain-containing protein [Chloroflexota bacterium]
MRPANTEPFIVVGIGASAGGLEALQRFFEQMPTTSGMAFVVVTHLAPKHESHLAALLQPCTTMPVVQVTEAILITPNQVYVIPPNRNIATIDSHLRLSLLEEARRERMPIDHFFRTLAATHAEKAIGIILSGTGSDGTIGLQCIRVEGGLTVVQEPADASYDGMPQSAIASGVADFILPIKSIPAQLIAYAANASRIQTPATTQESNTGSGSLEQILTYLRVQTGQDFARYKHATLVRRIRRRMQIHQIEALEDYLPFLREHPAEGELLCQDFLISVTQFFRDMEAFEELNQLVISHLFTGKDADDRVRVWVAGCATGEEAYSLAILLAEQTDYLRHESAIQIFATDLNERALRIAREGFYSEAIQAQVSPERLARFFTQKRGGYQVKRELRELVIFAPHNLLKDPPFSKLDLIVCRNLLIYLQRNVQRQLFELFHYALHPQGYLWLGTAETLAEAQLFHEISKSHCLFQRQIAVPPLPRLPNLTLGSPSRAGWPKTTPAVAPGSGSLGDLHQQMLERYAPPSMLINADYTIVHLSEHAGRYLQQAGGELTNHVLKRIRPELYNELTAALYTAFTEQQATDVKAIQMKLEGEPRYVSLSLRPALEAALQGYMLVLFDERAVPATAEPPANEAVSTLNHIQAEELAQFKQRLSTTIEQFEISKENMRATNEELLSMNEELHSTTEELETSKEELQSMNEELIAVNTELKRKLAELNRANSDLQNLLTATDIAILFLDRQLRIKQFTPHVSHFFNILATDQERPLAHITHKLAYPDLLEDAATVLRTHASLQREVSSEGGRWCLLRLLPYRTADDQIDGIVITLVDITERKQGEQQLAYHAHLLANMHDAVFATDPHFKLTVWNKGAEQMYGWQADEVIGHQVNAIVTSGDAEFRSVALRELADTGRYGTEIITYHRDGTAIDTEGLTMALHGEDGQLSGYLIINRDIRQRKQDEKRNADLFKEVARQGDLLRSLNTKLAAAQENERKEIARELHDRVGQNLTALSLNLRLVQSQLHDRQPTVDPLEVSIQDMRTLVGQMTELIRDVMADLRPPMLDDYGLLTTLKWYTAQLARRTDLVIHIQGNEPEPRLTEQIALGLFRITQEALNNVIKHARATRVTVTLTADAQHIYLSIADNGVGLDPTKIDHAHPQGWGVLTMGERATAIGGRFWLESLLGDGVVVWVEVAR